MPRGKKEQSQTSEALTLMEHIRQTIFFLRNQRVILDADLARIYGVTTKRLNEQVKRNIDRFPTDFMFQTTGDDLNAISSQIATLNTSNLKSQIATSSWGGRRKPPFAFTEHGAIMAATVLNSPQAVKASLFVVRAFVQLRELLSTHRELAQRLTDLENKLQKHDHQIHAIIEAIRQLMEPPETPPRPPIGFHFELATNGPSARALPAPTKTSANKIKFSRTRRQYV